MMTPEVNATSSVNVTTTVETVTGSLAGRGPPAIPVPIILRAIILLIMIVFNLCGCGFTLVTIRLTPRLWTKTNFILASMLVANILHALSVFWYAPFLFFFFSNPCRYSVLITANTPIFKIPGYASIYHLIVISVERYIAIVYPLHYETKFTERTMKWAIFAAWASGIILGMSFALWLINPDPRRCPLIPDHHQLIDFFLVYLPVCISLFTCYGKILAISWHQRQRVEPEPTNASPTAGSSGQTTKFATPQNSKATGGDNNTVDAKDKPLARTGPLAEPAVTSAAASAELTQLQQQQRQKIKARRREFKAVYLTAAIVGTFVILWFPHVLGRVLASVGLNPVVVNYLTLAAGAIGTANFSFSWVIYAAVSKSYRRAYRQMLIRIGCFCCKNVTLQADNSLIV